MPEPTCHLEIRRKNAEGRLETLDTTGPKSYISAAGDQFVASGPNTAKPGVISRVVAHYADSSDTTFFIEGLPHAVRMRCDDIPAGEPQPPTSTQQPRAPHTPGK